MYSVLSVQSKKYFKFVSPELLRYVTYHGLMVRPRRHEQRKKKYSNIY